MPTCGVEVADDQRRWCVEVGGIGDATDLGDVTGPRLERLSVGAGQRVHHHHAHDGIADVDHGIDREAAADRRHGGFDDGVAAEQGHAIAITCCTAGRELVSIAPAGSLEGGLDAGRELGDRDDVGIECEQ